jgi:hypothetical protein
LSATVSLSLRLLSGAFCVVRGLMALLFRCCTLLGFHVSPFVGTSCFVLGLFSLRLRLCCAFLIFLALAI